MCLLPFGLFPTIAGTQEREVVLRTTGVINWLVGTYRTIDKTHSQAWQSEENAGPGTETFFVCTLKLSYPRPVLMCNSGTPSKEGKGNSKTSALLQTENRVRNRGNARPPQKREHCSVSPPGETMGKNN